MKFINNLPPIEWTNLKELRDDRKAVLFTSPLAEKDCALYLNGLNIAEKILVQSSERAFVEKFARKTKTAEIGYALGGGRVIDVARFLAAKWGMGIICIPTIVSSDAFLVDCTGLRENGCVTYVPSKRADKVVLDWGLLKKVPFRYHLSGCGDVISIYTGLHDWEYINRQDAAARDETYNTSIATMARGILNGLLAQVEAIRKGTRQGLEAIVIALGMEVQLCNFYGNSRPEEGGEHFFTYCIENKVPHFLHGEMVAFATLLTACLQGQRWKDIKSFLETIELNYIPEGLTVQAVRKTLEELPDYVKTHKLRKSVFNDFDYRASKTKVDVFLKTVGMLH